MTLSKDTCSNKLGLSKSPKSSIGILLGYRPLNIVFKMYYPKSRYLLADHYKNGYVPQKTTILK